MLVLLAATATTTTRIACSSSSSSGGCEEHNLQVGIILVIGTIVGVSDRNWNWRQPAEQVEPFEYLVFANKGHHKQGVQVEALAEHPKVI